MNRTYRATVRGRFTGMTEAQRAALRAEQAEHDMFAASFSPEGTFLYAPELVAYQFRYLLDVDEETPDDADLAAELEAEERAEANLAARGLAGRIVSVDLVCVEDVKVRKP